MTDAPLTTAEIVAALPQVSALLAWLARPDVMADIQAGATVAEKLTQLARRLGAPDGESVQIGLDIKLTAENLPRIVAAARAVLPEIETFATMFAPSDAPRWSGAPNAI